MGPASLDHPDSDLFHRFREDRMARDELTDTLLLDQIWPGDFDALLCIGTPGPAGDLVATFRKTGKPVAVIRPIEWMAASPSPPTGPMPRCRRPAP